MKFSSVKPAGILIFIIALSWQFGRSQSQSFVLDDGTPLLVLIQLKPEAKDQDSLESVNTVKSAVDQIKAINANRASDPVNRMIATTTLETGGQHTTYLAVRNFADFKTAESYANEIAKEIKGDILGEIKAPIPINVTNYKICMTEKDFVSYYKFYEKSKK